MKTVKELKADDCLSGDEFMVSGFTTGTTKGGKPFASLKLNDKTGSVSAKIWDYGMRSCDNFVKDGAIIRIVGRVEVYKDQPQVVISEIGPAVNTDASRYEKVSAFNPATMKSLFDKFVSAFESVLMTTIAKEIIDLCEQEIMGGFMNKPAATGMHHAFKHGLLEHTTQMLETADKLFELPFYADNLNKDLCMFGIMFHDYGKIFEYGDGPGFKKTVSGVKVTHLPKLAAIIYHVCKTWDISSELCDELMSVVLSHHGEIAYGSPVMPSTPEGWFVHYVDNLHGKVFGILQALENDSSGDEMIKYGYGDSKHSITKKRFADVLKETENAHYGTKIEENVSGTVGIAGQETDMGGF